MKNTKGLTRRELLVRSGWLTLGAAFAGLPTHLLAEHLGGELGKTWPHSTSLMPAPWAQ